MFLRTTGFYLGLSLIASSTYANMRINQGFETCTRFFHGNAAPLITNKALQKNNYQICFSGMAVSYSGSHKTGLFSAEYVTSESLKRAKSINRQDNFHEESKIPFKFRSTLDDYRGSGFDRGHLAPNGNRSDRTDQYESFSLANIAPQAPFNNQEAWRLAEEATRAFITRTKQPAYIITGTLFKGGYKKIGKGVAVPTHIYKVVYYPTLNSMSAYVTVNDNSGKIDYVSVMQLQEQTGITYFPALKDTSLLTQRVVLPLNANEAYKMTSLRRLGASQSYIFDQTQEKAFMPVPVKNINHKAKGQDVKALIKANERQVKEAVKQSERVFKSIF